MWSLVGIFLSTLLPSHGLFFDPKCPDRFACHENKKVRCIDLKLVCNGVKDCLGGEDEDYCDQDICRPNEELCLNGYCVPKYFHRKRCDGKKDCADGSDETGCTTVGGEITTTTTPDSTSNTYVDLKICDIEKTFKCNDGRCLPKSQVCDSIPQCSNGEDEFDFLCKLKNSHDESQTSWKFWALLAFSVVLLICVVGLLIMSMCQVRPERYHQFSKGSRVQPQDDPQFWHLPNRPVMRREDDNDTSEYAYPQFSTRSGSIRSINRTRADPDALNPHRNSYIEVIQDPENDEPSAPIPSTPHPTHGCLARGSFSSLNLHNSSTHASSIIDLADYGEKRTSIHDMLGNPETKSHNYFMLSYQNLQEAVDDQKSSSESEEEFYGRDHYLLPNEARPKSTIVTMI